MIILIVLTLTLLYYVDNNKNNIKNLDLKKLLLYLYILLYLNLYVFKYI